MSERIGRPVQMRSGHPFWPLDPRALEIRTDDVAAHLGAVCRYGGATLHHYSVAQHAVLLSYVVPPELSWKTLHHEDPEAWLGDLLGPNKDAFSDYTAAEKLGWRATCERYHMTEHIPGVLRELDTRMRVNERRDLLIPSTFSWGPLDQMTPLDFSCVPATLRNLLLRVSPLYGWEIRPLPRGEAADIWLWRFNDLVKKGLGRL